jgi:predicted HTH transcriptional regulator
MITDRASARDVTADDIHELIEDQTIEESALEYKETPDADLLKEACGIANFGGGFILVGISGGRQASSIGNQGCAQESKCG